MKTRHIETKLAKTVAKQIGAHPRAFIRACENGLVKGAVYDPQTANWRVQIPTTLHYKAAQRKAA